MIEKIKTLHFTGFLLLYFSFSTTHCIWNNYRIGSVSFHYSFLLSTILHWRDWWFLNKTCYEKEYCYGHSFYTHTLRSQFYAKCWGYKYEDHCFSRTLKCKDETKKVPGEKHKIWECIEHKMGNNKNISSAGSRGMFRWGFLVENDTWNESSWEW